MVRARLYRGLTEGSSPSGRSSSERRATGLSRFPYLEAGQRWARSARPRQVGGAGAPETPPRPHPALTAAE